MSHTIGSGNSRRIPLAFLLEDIGVLAALRGDAAAGLELIGAAEAIRKVIGAPRAPSLEQGSRGSSPAPRQRSPKPIARCSARTDKRSTLRLRVERAFAACEKA